MHRNGFCSVQTVGLASVLVVQGSLNSTAVHSSLSQDLVLHHCFVVVVIMFIYCTIRMCGLDSLPCVTLLAGVFASDFFCAVIRLWSIRQQAGWCHGLTDTKE